MDFKITKMELKDKKTVIDMMKEFYSSDAVLSSGSMDIFENDVNICVSDSPYAEGYVFTSDNVFLGYAMLAKSYSTEFGKLCVWIEDLYIKKEYRGTGIGSAFFEMLFSLYNDVLYRLEVEKENTAAMSLYKKYGFEIIPYTEMIRK